MVVHAGRPARAGSSGSREGSGRSGGPAEVLTELLAGAGRSQIAMAAMRQTTRIDIAGLRQAHAGSPRVQHSIRGGLLWAVARHQYWTVPKYFAAACNAAAGL